MANPKLLLLLILPLSFVVPGQVADAPEVIITLKTGEEWQRGEILFVRHQSVLFIPKHGATDEFLSGHPHSVVTTRVENVKTVSLRGRSHLWQGFEWGAVLGCLAGTVIGMGEKNQSGEEFLKNTYTGCGVGSLGGGTVGLALGGVFSEEDSVIFGGDNRDLVGLRKFSRYQEREPEFLRSVGR